MDEIIQAVKLVLTNLAAFQRQLSVCESDIQKNIEEEGSQGNPRFAEAINAFADLMNFNIDPNSKRFQKAANFLTHYYQEVRQCSEKTLERMSSMGEVACADYIDDLRAKYNIPALGEFGLRVEEKSKPILNHIESAHKRYQAIVKDVNKILTADRPNSMGKIEDYKNLNKQLQAARYAIEMNNEKIEYALRLLSQQGSIMMEGFKIPPEEMNVSDFIKVIIRLGGFPMVSDRELNAWLETLKESLLNILTDYPVTVTLFQINFVSIDRLADQYDVTLKSIRLCYELLRENQQNPTHQDIMEKKFIGRLQEEKDYEIAKLKASELFHQQVKRYKESYQNTLRAIKLLGNATVTKEENEKNVEIAIPGMENKIAERIRVKLREEAYSRERYCFESGQYNDVDGEGFQKLKETFFSTSASRKIINLLLKHAEGHVRKGGLIKSFLVTLEKSKNLGELLETMEMASHFANLIECRTALGRRFRVMSTTGALVSKLNVELKKLLMEEKKQLEVFNSVKMAIEDEKSAIFAATEKYRFEVIYKDFLIIVENKVGNHACIAALKEELIGISLWTSNNEAKVSRMALEIFQVKKKLESTPAEGMFNQFCEKYRDVFKDITQQQNEFPFTYRYHVLKKHLAPVKTFRKDTLKKLWASLDHLAVQDDTEINKMQRMQPILNAYYMNIRESYRGSPGLLFSKGSRLANALRDFMVAKQGLFMREEYVPVRAGFRFF